jgi:hypothetical protein
MQDWQGVKLVVGGQSWSVQGERDDLAGARCFTAAHAPQFTNPAATVLLDSGAFTDSPAGRLTPDGALARQLAWERAAGERLEREWQAETLVSYDLLIDEVWTNGLRHKRRWSVREADGAVRETVAGAAYLASQRAALAPRRLMLSCQGVDAIQYAECAAAVLRYAVAGDVIGLGGWCILGRWQSWLPEFWATCYSVLPLIAHAGVDRVHILGVLWQPALGGLLWLADQHGISVSTDSSAPLLACTRGDLKKAGARAPYWRDNVEWWRKTLAELRSSAYYRQPPRPIAGRQLELWGAA